MTSRFLPTMAIAAAGWLLPADAVAQETGRLLARPAADFIPRPTAAAPPPDDPADTCGLLPTEAPEFTLEDVNPSSPTYGQMVDRTDAGHVTVLYIALASCGHCQADTDALGALVAEQGEAWAEVSVRVLALNTALDSLPELADGHDLPILVDTDELDLEGKYGAERWYIYLLDRSGIPATLHYELNFSTERERLVEQVQTLLAGESLP